MGKMAGNMDDSCPMWKLTCLGAQRGLGKIGKNMETRQSRKETNK
jgi:hypothetical protein